MQISQICKPIRDRLNQALIQAIPEETSLLYQAARYALEGGGKRIRPILVLLSCHDLGGEMDLGYDSALALEMIHNYSLIHDDLPCMDNDDFRRGRPTVHRAFGEAQAVLCGDYLLTLAFSILSNNSSITAEHQVNLISRLAYYSGGKELLEGQIQDLAMINKKGSLKILEEVYLKKTSSLFSCALEFGAILANKDAETQKVMRDAGKLLGLAFQIENDFLGKEKDLEGQKFTVLSLLSDKQARVLQQKYLQEIKTLFSTLDLSMTLVNDFLNEMFLG